MRYFLAIVLASTFSCFAGDPQATNTIAQLPEARTEHHEWKDENDLIRYRDDVYRGKERILRTVRFQKHETSAWQTWRYFYIDNKAVMFEDDHAGEKPTTISLLKDGQTYDEFILQPDGSLRPLSADELAKIKEDERKFTKDAEKFTDVLATQLATNSTGNVTQMVNEAVQQFKKDATGKVKQ